jgi:PRTRC genetic system protein E
MFEELMPLINNRPLTLTVVPLTGGKIRVCVIPQTVDSDKNINDKAGYHKEVAKVPEVAIKALTTPLCLEGTPAEIDAEMPDQLIKFSEAHVVLQGALEHAQKEMADAVKAIEERSKSKSKPGKQAQAGSNDRKGPSAKPDQENKPEDKSEQPMDLPLAWCTSSSADPGTGSGGRGDGEEATSGKQQQEAAQ